ALHFDHFALVVHEVVHREVFLERIVDAIEAALLEPGEIQGGLPKGLARNGTGVDAAAARMVRALDDRDALAEIGSLRAGFLACRTATDDDQIEGLSRRHKPS